MSDPSTVANVAVKGAAPIWQRRSRWLLQVFAPVLIATGIAGFVIPPAASLMSGAPAYNVFHIIAGSLGAALALTGSAAAASAFNVGFGAIDLYQAVAGLAGLPPAQLFALRPADHVVHVVLGALLVAVGWRGRPGVNG
ncbi:MAG TPA: hypothetical protein VMU50_19510 [Polyangia bacterium]|nr:hypothetical protein [Polyangia bacterium]